jgi:hypothetical protein
MLQDTQAEARAKCPDRDKRVRVTGGKNWVGVTGRVFWTGPDKFNDDRCRLGIKVDDCPELRAGYLPDTIFESSANVEVLDWEQYMPGAKRVIVVKKRQP